MVRKNVWFSSQVLPVVSIDTSFLVMVFTPGTPDRLKIKHVEVSVFRLNRVQQVDSNFFLRVSEGTHLSVLAIFHVVRIVLTELGLVLFRVIKLLYSVVCLEAAFAK